MGKGDMRTRKGKIYRGSHGRTRPGKSKPSAAATAVAKRPARKTARKK
jgi:30S ribosomal protein S31